MSAGWTMCVRRRPCCKSGTETALAFNASRAGAFAKERVRSTPAFMNEPAEPAGRRGALGGSRYLEGRDGGWGTCPRFHTMNVRLNSMIGVPSWFTPVVFTRTMPTWGRDFDSRVSSTSLRE